jgi:poly-gamma-glutamate capsule biosynthesis protein CapA/YwtB (metallophosphatase superfamily)
MDNSPTLRIAVVGDLQLHGTCRDPTGVGTPDDRFAQLRALIGGADLGIGDLETVLTCDGTPRDDKLCLDGDPSYARALARAGLNLVTLANNHALDYGAAGLAQMLGHLHAAGIQTLGAGPDLHAAMAPLIIETKGIRLGFLAACHPSTRPVTAAADGPGAIAMLAAKTLLPAIEALKARVDHVILLLHWGLEYSHLPTPEQVELARAAIDRGASAILGDHSHALQGIEHYGQGVIVYCQGNLTDAPVDWQGPRRRYQCEVEEVDRESILVRLHVTPERIEIAETVPLWLDDQGRPTAAVGERAAKIRAALAEHSARIGSEDLKRYWEETVIGSRVSAPLKSWWQDGSLWDKVRRFRPGQLVSAWLLLRAWLRLRFSRAESRWELFSDRNDLRPMPSVKRRPADD